MTNQSKIVRDLLLYALLILGIGWVIFTYQILISPLIISGLIAYLLYPGVTWISYHTKLDKYQIVPIVYLIFLITLILGVTFFAPFIVSQFVSLTDQLTRLPEILIMAQSNLEELLGFSVPIESFFTNIGSDVGQLLKPDRIFRIIRGASANFVLVVIIIITSFYLLRDWEKLREWIFGLSPQELEPDLRRLHQEIKAVWQTYMRGQLLIMSIIGILSGLGAAFLGIPGALILGFLAGSLALIPGLGPATATTIAAIVAWTQGSHYLIFSNLTVTVLVVIVFQGIQLLEGFWLTPHMMSRRLNLHPGLVLIAVISTLFTLGALMALIIIPLLGSLELVFQYARRRRSGLDPWLTEDTCVQMISAEAFQSHESITSENTELTQAI